MCCRDQLRCVIGIIRHGDRTPKQKMKMIVSHKKFYQLFEEMNGYATGHVKIKEPQKMQVHHCNSVLEFSLYWMRLFRPILPSMVHW